ncbi:hypothetical protein [Natronobacterium gregoryi]|uniref:Uncharacterized protein n=2 Tax=Natronobacterium gregoryi TaxID=44930 RepID=L0AN89_NATGS|nr:hypothetical protein [Natronobacterium gregoryi]AFZ74545.1 hypothetical protein Natgr_3426 [Natronobacterium gregoryi SP2]ELY72383.1 hypothetical protein C490_03528 [Natronobacterium gregoryi SP2]PLK21711.1 hypothetical protein CYV19_02420 [Natronobacterium gregoryi SP2]SFI96606.1 hypothetical protein SAMN05443661_110160 [Natronobacterium gregoryi]
MGYTFNCDVCEDRYDHAPAFMGEFREQFLKTSPSTLTQLFQPGETATICQECAEALFLSGKLAVCTRCGYAEHATELPAGLETCPRCDEKDTFDFRGVDHDE